MYEWILRKLNYNQGLRGKFFWSSKQDEVSRRHLFIDPITNKLTPYHKNHCLLDNGRTVQYSQMNSDFDGNNNWDDHIYLGRGKYAFRQKAD